MAIALRLLLLPVDPYTSSDTKRYLFDGKLALESFDPYTIPHDHEDIEDLRSQWAPPDEHAKYGTLYPPLALGVFVWSAYFGIDNALLAWKTL